MELRIDLHQKLSASEKMVGIGAIMSEVRRKIGEGREVKWDDLDRSWASRVDDMDPMLPGDHIRWAMSVR